MKKAKPILTGIEEVEIGLDTANKFETEDTERVLQVGDIVYRILIPTAIDEEAVYFDEYENAEDYLRDFE